MQVDQGEQKPQGDGQKESADKKSDSEDMEVSTVLTLHQNSLLMS